MPSCPGFCNNDHICNFCGVVLLLEIILERCCVYTRVQKYFSCQGRGGQVSPGVREEVVSSVLQVVREEVVSSVLQDVREEVVSSALQDVREEVS